MLLMKIDITHPAYCLLLSVIRVNARARISVMCPTCCCNVMSPVGVVSSALCARTSRPANISAHIVAARSNTAESAVDLYMSAGGGGRASDPVSRLLCAMRASCGAPEWRDVDAATAAAAPKTFAV